MYELSLFTGAGGGLLGTYLLGWTPIGYVEFNDYCQRIIRQRIIDGILPNAPIFGDVRAFISEGYAASYTGMVDVITAGFPCQPFSTAGRRLSEDDPRNMWPATIECIRVVRLKYAILENVPGLISSGYFGTILGDLAESGYDARWRILSAAEMGAPHKRDRIFILCSDSVRVTGGTKQEREHERAKESIGSCRIWLDARTKMGLPGNREKEFVYDVCNSSGKRFQNQRYTKMGGRKKRNTELQSQRSNWWEAEPELGRVVNGMANRVDRLKAIGNGQVPAVVAAVWELLNCQE